MAKYKVGDRFKDGVDGVSRVLAIHEAGSHVSYWILDEDPNEAMTVGEAYLDSTIKIEPFFELGKKYVPLMIEGDYITYEITHVEPADGERGAYVVAWRFDDRENSEDLDNWRILRPHTFKRFREI